MNALIEQHIEALIFASEQSLGIDEMLQCVQAMFEQDIKANDITLHLESIRLKYQSPQLAIELVKTGNGYAFLTKKEYHAIIDRLQQQQSKKKLSQSALETLAVIAYKQPVTRLDVEQIRGVNSEYSIQKLLEKELIVISGKSETVGKPMLYATSALFMDYFGINHINELPQIKEFIETASSIGEQQE